MHSFTKIILWEKEDVHAERKLITYVYVVGKQPTENAWCKTVGNDAADCEIWVGHRHVFWKLWLCYIMIIWWYWL